MNRDFAKSKQAACATPPADAEADQRAQNRRAFQAKYEAMLDIAEFIATFRPPFAAPRPDKGAEALKTTVDQVRARLRG